MGHHLSKMWALRKPISYTRSLTGCLASTAGNHMPTASTVCPKESEIFKKVASQWWDPNGCMRILMNLTPLRIELLIESLTHAGLVKTDGIHAARPLENIKILDIGSGGGFLSEATAKLGAQVTGIEPNETLVSVAEEHKKLDGSLQDNLEYKFTTIETFAQQNEEKYDVVMASEVIEHVTDPEVFAHHALKCLRPGGSAFFTTMNRTPLSGFYYIYLFENWFSLIPKGVHEYKKFMRPEEMKQLYTKNKCIPVNVHGFTLNLFTKKWFRLNSSQLNFAIHAIKQTRTGI